ncbi:ABC transporter ATP-binding protein [Sutcliffiella rhizosphaerae]|uniref:Vitamin B12 import ATP-binding protein BtuD n=1 Tax=Sutcliffiella rhizosphaerae TaxID=2880967 RepID=A0ABM8YLD7_9BACI|nr:ABC transporter ATP-binding protein [Sutcliffiella rhizosphaerae]CAG9620780.1 Vitamin B12 import ATP-binding protein BtuD [Sutcliffiella rhizosphaerae]
MSLIEKSHLQVQIEGNLLFLAKSDMDEAGKFEERWLAISDREIQLLDRQGNKLKKFEVAAIISSQMEQYIGAGSLIVEQSQGKEVVLRFSSSFMQKFSIADRVINSLAKKEEIPKLSKEDQPKQCPNCQRPFDDGTAVCSVCVDRKKVIGRVLDFTKPYRGKVILSILFLIIATLLELAPPYITKIIVDDVLEPKDMGSALLILVLLLGVTGLVLALMQFLNGVLGVWIGSKIMGDIRKEIYESLMRLSVSYFDRRQTSQFIGRVNSDAESIRRFLTEGVLYIISQLMLLIALILMMFSLNWKLALFALLPSPIVLLFSIFIWPRVQHLWYKQWQSINKLNMIVGDALQGIRVVKAFGQEGQEKNRYIQGNHALVSQTIKTDGMWQGVFPLFSFITGTGMLLVWYFGGLSVISDDISLGTLLAFVAYLGMFFGPLQWFNQMLSWVSEGVSSGNRIFEIIDAPAEVPDKKNAKVLERIEGLVQIENVTFGYEKHNPVIKNIELDVKAGEMIGLVGHSGAGKSTLINLITRFYDPNEGRIMLDGVDLKDLKQEQLHQNIGVVLQETFLFDGTIAENIAYSKQDATPEEIMRAAKIANAHEFVVKMADGYDTKVGERGHRLSGGQKQRVAIARAILHDPRILILDEATASVDTETERKIQEAISRLVKGRTTFAIAHRLSTLRNADRLVVIDKGKIAEVGTHDELLEKEGIYYKLVEAQKELSQIKGVEA